MTPRKEGRNTTMAMLILLVLLIFFVALGVPLAFAIGASCISYIVTNAPNFCHAAPVSGTMMFSELMIAMPLFIAGGRADEPAASPSVSSTSVSSVSCAGARGGLGEVKHRYFHDLWRHLWFLCGRYLGPRSHPDPAVERKQHTLDAAAGITVASSHHGHDHPALPPMIVYSP